MPFRNYGQLNYSIDARIIYSKNLDFGAVVVAHLAEQQLLTTQYPGLNPVIGNFY